MGDDADKTVPYNRFETVNQRMQAAEGRVTSLEGELAALRRQTQEKDQAIASANARVERVQTLARHGFAEPELADLVEYSYGRLPEQGRPQLASWLQTITADPGQAPLALRPHLQGRGQPTPPAADQSGQPPGTQPAPGNGTQPPAGQGQPAQGQRQGAPATQGQPAGTPLPPGNAGVIQQPHTAGALTADQVLRMSDQDLMRSLPGLMQAHPSLARNPVVQALAAQGVATPTSGQAPPSPGAGQN